MSTVKVNKITPRTCNSIQLGESGDTLTIPSGATLQNCGTSTGFGLAFCTTVKTSPFTATANKGFFINTGSAVTVTLPASPSTGDELIVIDSTGQAATNNITLGRNGSKIKGLCMDADIKVNRGGLRIVYSGSSQGWVTVTSANDATASQVAYVTATGGTVTTCGDFKIHTFNASGCFSVSCAGTSSGSNKVSYFVVAGGAGGGSGYGGGGGAGGFREGKCSSDPYTDSPLDSGVGLSVPAATYPITVGAGGTGGAPPSPATSSGGSGNNSIFSTITSAGGGGGGKNCGTAGIAGGSGGGGGAACAAGGAGNTPPVSPPQGNPGGTASPGHPVGYYGGGGGGAGAAGTDGSPTNNTGGAGLATSITGSPVTRGGGGGGSHYPSPSRPTPGAAGGSGGGGAGGSAGPNPYTAAVAGTDNTGGGGGAGGFNPGSGHQPGGAGGSGTVIIRYKFQN
ncbi:MAG: hypothetical protein CBD63_04195 [Candidatus Pelagibacter sp. TMED203]|nr:MAG: hypothetical protein CBD63_04195 [Candidatus Pelagibacter sp. TMED203]|tara:strand:- start:3045 stop:4403 length:1359 start_codon:yes stop_codon:yes gene_type:complete